MVPGAGTMSAKPLEEKAQESISVFHPQTKRWGRAGDWEPSECPYSAIHWCPAAPTTLSLKKDDACSLIITKRKIPM